MPSPKLRAKSLRDRFSLTVEEEAEQGIQWSEYYSPLSPYLLPEAWITDIERRRDMIRTARDHEAKTAHLVPVPGDPRYEEWAERRARKLEQRSKENIQ